MLEGMEVANRPVNKVDDTILRYADSRSPEEISMLLKGVITPKAVAARTQTLLQTRNWLTLAQEEQLLLLKMHDVLHDIENKYQDDKMLTLRIKALKEIGVVIERRKKTLDVDLTTYSQNVGRVLGQVVDKSLAYMKGALRDQVDPDLWDQLVTEAMREARDEITLHQAVEE